MTEKDLPDMRAGDVVRFQAQGNVINAAVMSMEFKFDRLGITQREIGLEALFGEGMAEPVPSAWFSLDDDWIRIFEG
jgi:hypothetical protein